jgi:Family of unknown function (DUF6072)
MATNPNEVSGGKLVARGLKLVGEKVVPGASLILDGNIGAGALHVVAGSLARTVLGPLGLLLVAANSYSKSTTGRGLLGHFQFQSPVRTDSGQ